MYLDGILEVAIGLVMTWLILSVANMHIQDWLSKVFNWRAQFLENTLRDMLKNDSLVNMFYQSPAIRDLCRVKNGKIQKPAYVTASRFSAALMDIVMNAGQPAGETAMATGPSLAKLRSNIQQLKSENPSLGRTLDHIFPNLDQDEVSLDEKIALYRTNSETWFNGVMDQLSSWYKEHASRWALIIGMVLAVLFNIDTVQMADQLWREPTVRQAIVATAQNNQASQTSPGVESLTQVPSVVNSLAIPVGWTTVPAANQNMCNWPPQPENHPAIWSGSACRELINLPAVGDIWGWVTKIFGILLSGLAASAGAPFWFDILRKLLNLRNPASADTSTAPTPVPTPTPTGPVG